MARGLARSTNRAGAAWSAAIVLGTVAVAGVLAWRRRWISDDGLVVVRTARQILAGHGPVYNVGERAEATTSTLWTWLLTLVTWATDQPAAHVAVALGGVLGCVGLGLGVDATRRWWRLAIDEDRGTPGPTLRGLPVPAGVVIYLALPPSWDFLTSGLETGLATGWLGLSWWTLVRLAEAAQSRIPTRALITGSVVLGLGPLVRPEFAVVSFGYWVAVVVLARPGAGRAIAAAACGLLAPAAYEVFRMGYYGLLVPLPAVAKEAGRSNLHQGLLYLADFMSPYRLWLPGLLVVALLVCAALGFRTAPGPLAIATVPMLCGIVIGAYVVLVGGDFIHARLLLPALLLLLLPVLVVPANLAVGAGIVGVGVWAVWCALFLRPDYATLGPDRIDQERALFVHYTRDPHPVDERPFLLHGWALLNDEAQHAREVGTRQLMYRKGDSFATVPMRLDAPADLAFSWPNPGILGAVATLDEQVLDPSGLTYPLAAHMEPTYLDRPGHTKAISAAWLAADFGPPLSDETGQSMTPGEEPIVAAQRALRCGALKEMLDAGRQPLTWARFWSNVAGSPGRTFLRVPVDPSDAASRFCRTP